MAQHLALLHRGGYRLAVQHHLPGKGGGVQVRGEGGLQDPLGLHAHVVGLLGQGHLHLVPQGGGVQHGLPREIFEAPLQQAAALGKLGHTPAAGGVGLPHAAQDHGNQIPAVPAGRGGQAEPRLRRGAGLDAGGVLVQVADVTEVGDQGVGLVELPGLVEVGGGDRVAHRAHDGAEGGVLHGLGAHYGDVIGRGVVVLIVVAMGVGEVGAGHAQLRRPLVHQVHKVGHAARHRLSQHVACLVGGGGEGAVEYVLQPHDLPLLDVLGGAARAHLVVDLRAHGDPVVQGELAVVHGLYRQQGGHHLGDAGGIAALVGILVIEHVQRAVGGVHQDGRRGLHLHAVQDGAAAFSGLGGAHGGEEAQGQAQSEQK